MVYEMFKHTAYSRLKKNLYLLAQNFKLLNKNKKGTKLL